MSKRGLLAEYYRCLSDAYSSLTPFSIFQSILRSHASSCVAGGSSVFVLYGSKNFVGNVRKTVGPIIDTERAMTWSFAICYCVPILARSQCSLMYPCSCSNAPIRAGMVFGG